MATGPVGPIAYRIHGDPGPEGTVVLLHPINSSAAAWDRVAPLLSGASVAIDLRGHGASTPSGPFSLEGWMDDLLAVLDALDLRTVHLAGGSFGGAVCLALAGAHPGRVRSVTTFGSLLGRRLTSEQVEAGLAPILELGGDGFFRAHVPQILGPAYRTSELVAATIAASGSRPTETVAGVLRGARQGDVRPLLTTLRCPVMAAVGTADPTTPPGMSREIADATGGSYVELSGVGHMPMIEVPDQVAAVIEKNVQTGGSTA